MYPDMEKSKDVCVTVQPIPDQNLSSEHLQVNSDVEKSASTISISDVSSEGKPEITLVSWDSPTDPENPKNWPRRKKWTVTIMISAFAFLAPLSSSMSAPALSSIATSLHISSGMQTNLVLSVFLLAYSFGPFILSPCSEIWGRKYIIVGGNLVFILFNTACGFARTQGELTAFRLLAGLGGSANMGIGSGVLSDCWRVEERGKGMSIYQLAPVLGPALAPIAGGFIAQYTTWRWAFWSISIFSLTLQFIALFLLKESFAPRLLAQKAARLRRKLNTPNFRSEYDDRKLSALLMKSLRRPWRLLGTQPIIQILALYQAFNFGMLYLIISSLPALFEDRYHMSKGVASLHYLSLVGSLLGSQLCGPLTDRIHASLRKKYGFGEGQGLPEFRMPLMIPASVVNAGGIFLFGWAAEAKLHWIWPDIGVAMYGGGSMICYLSIQMYIVDAYTRYAASASSASALLRTLAAFSFPLFAPGMFQKLGYGMGCTVLGSVAVCLGIPAPILLWKFGARIRARSQYAAGN